MDNPTVIDAIDYELPDRGTPEAVVFLAQLATKNPILDGESLRPRLLVLSAALNELLPERLRVSPLDSRLNGTPKTGSRPLAEVALAAIGAYTTNPAIEPTLRARGKAFLTLNRYFVWCKGMWTAVERWQPDVAAFSYSYETMPPSKDLGELSMGAILHWLASLCVVVEGWEELELHDEDIDRRLREGGDVKATGSLRHRLQRLRNGVFHFQNAGTDDARFQDFWGSNVAQWAIPLESAFERFFLKAWESRQASIEEWLFHGLEPRYDPAIDALLGIDRSKK